MHKTIAVAAAALAFILPAVAPLAAAAQDAPSYAVGPAPGPQDEQIRGRILSFDGAYALTVRDGRGFVDNVQLHEGTIINPTGLTLEPGMIVSILGYNQGPYFAANEVDTPYTYDGGVPYYGGHPWNYYGPGISLGFFFGNTGWWHGGYFGGGGFHYVGGARVYDSVHVNNVYRQNAPGGAFHGRTYVAPRAAGGYHAAAAHAGSRGGGGHGRP